MAASNKREIGAVLAKARKHFADRPRGSIKIPQWDATVFASPLTLADRQRLYKRAKDDDLALSVYAAIFHAEDEQGEKMFTLEDKPTLMTEVDPDIIGKIAQMVLDVTTAEDAEKN